MAIKIEWSQPAQDQLQQIYDYHVALASQRTARKLTTKIMLRVDILANNALVGPCEELLEDYPDEFRYLVEGNYKIVYRLKNNLATIAAVFDCRQNPIKIREIK